MAGFLTGGIGDMIGAVNSVVNGNYPTGPIQNNASPSAWGQVAQQGNPQAMGGNPNAQGNQPSNPWMSNNAQNASIMNNYKQGALKAAATILKGKKGVTKEEFAQLAGKNLQDSIEKLKLADAIDFSYNKDGSVKKGGGDGIIDESDISAYIATLDKTDGRADGNVNNQAEVFAQQAAQAKDGSDKLRGAIQTTHKTFQFGQNSIPEPAKMQEDTKNEEVKEMYDNYKKTGKLPEGMTKALFDKLVASAGIDTTQTPAAAPTGQQPGAAAVPDKPATPATPPAAPNAAPKNEKAADDPTDKDVPIKNEDLIKSMDSSISDKVTIPSGHWYTWDPTVKGVLKDNIDRLSEDEKKQIAENLSGLKDVQIYNQKDDNKNIESLKTIAQNVRQRNELISSIDGKSQGLSRQSDDEIKAFSQLKERLTKFDSKTDSMEKIQKDFENASEYYHHEGRTFG